VILLDTSGLLAAMFGDQRHHRDCADVLRSSEPPLLLSPFVLAELDSLISKLAGVGVELELLTEVASGAYDLVPFGGSEIGQCRAVVQQYAEHGIGLADASIVVLARLFGTVDVLTLDERHFRVLPGAGGRPFRVLPADVRR
jgi:uncharacterized protein